MRPESIHVDAFTGQVEPRRLSLALPKLKELLIIPDVILFLIHFAGEDHADGAGGEVLKVTPHAGFHVETLVGAVEEKGSLAFAVVEGDGERA